MNAYIKIDLCSPPDRDELVAAIMIRGEQWAEVNRESGKLTVELYPRQDGAPWVFTFDEVIDALLAAKNRLVGTSE